MYVHDGMVYGSEPNAGLLVDQCRYVGDGIFIVLFSTGETRLFDATCLFGMPAFEALRDFSVLENFTIEDGVVTWLNGAVDIAPEGLYSRSHEYESVA